MSDLCLFITHFLNGYLVGLWTLTKTNSETVQGISAILTTLIALFSLGVAWQLSFLTRKKAIINLELNNNKWIITNTGDQTLKNVIISVQNLYISEHGILIDDRWEIYERFIDNVKKSRYKKVVLGDLGIGQLYEINNIILTGKLEKGFNVFRDENKIYETRAAFFEEVNRINEKENRDGTYQVKSQNEKDEDQQIQETEESAFGEITYLEIKVIGDGYNQTIKYMR